MAMERCTLPSAFCDCMECNMRFPDRPWKRPAQYAKPAFKRKGDWMQTATGRAFWPLDPRPEEIHIDDIAHALGMQCRYGGHTLKFYSVAEHCVHMARHAPTGLELATLMHDASEAYLADMIRPIKRSMPEYKAVEFALEKCIAERFDLPYPLPAEVKRLDERIVHDEKPQVLNPPPFAWDPCVEQCEPLGVTLQFWTPAQARYEFLVAFQRYGGR